MVAQHLEELGLRPKSQHMLWLGLGFVGIWAWLWFIRYCLYRGCMMTADTADNIGWAYGFLHHGEWVLGGGDRQNPMSLHFLFLEGLFSPILLLWNSPVSLLFLENLVLASGPVAAYCLVWRLTKSSLAAFVGMLLALSSPVLYEILLPALICLTIGAAF